MYRKIDLTCLYIRTNKWERIGMLRRSVREKRSLRGGPSTDLDERVTFATIATKSMPMKLHLSTTRRMFTSNVRNATGRFSGVTGLQVRARQCIAASSREFLGQ